MSYNKEFEFQNNNLVLKNMNDLHDELRKKVKLFSNYDNFTNKEKMLELIGEIVLLCEHDKETAIFNYEDLNMVEFNKDEIEDKAIYFYNFAQYFGMIFVNIFDKPQIKINHVRDGINGAISTKEMFEEAHNILIQKKSQEVLSINSYGVTLILATLIENSLKSKIKRVYMKELLMQLVSKIENGEICLNNNEEDLLKYLSNQYNESKHDCDNYEAVNATTMLSYKLFLDKGIISNTDKEYEKLIKNTFTLNQLIQSSLFNNKVDTRFIDALKIVFGTNKMNLRNELAHCNFGKINYYNYSVTFLLYGLFMYISEDYFLSN